MKQTYEIVPEFQLWILEEIRDFLDKINGIKYDIDIKCNDEYGRYISLSIDKNSLSDKQLQKIDEYMENFNDGDVY